MAKLTKEQRAALAVYQRARADLAAGEATLLRAMDWTPHSVLASFGARETKWRQPGAHGIIHSQRDAVSLVEREIEEARG